ncbi:M48 family metallopeptidase [Novosphingobium sp.]|uniref:M48 family metallopeptidase n=1 Tax=Novosphingobium sp. TaxID=1874826 RepID=UPI0025FF9686|nr:M48 family metallopeptidase [Novosphingobium sp.]
MKRAMWMIALAAGVAAFAVPALAEAPVPVAPFDVTEATRAYLDTLQGAARAKSNAYFEGGYWLILWGALVSIMIDGAILRFGLSARFRDMGERVFKAKAGVTWITALLYTLVSFVITLPWSIYTGFVREKQYGLMNQTFGAWAGDQAKGLAIALVLVPLIVMAIYAVIRRSPKHWWIYGTGVVAVFMTIGAIIAPVYLAPLFNTYKELPASPARTRIVEMAKANNIPADHIYLFDASRQTKRISANVSGLGPTIRISVNDNLINRTTLPETAAVVGHEMGHYVLGHARRGLLYLVLLAAAALWIVSRVAPALIKRHGERWGVRNLADPASLPVLSILLAIMGLVATPITNTITRTAESDADAFGLNAAREPDGFALAAMQLSEYRKIQPDPLEEMVFYDHPSGATRVRMSMQWKKDHVPNAVMVTPPPMVPDAPAGQITPSAK